jgi:hypothetical protein
MQQPTPGGGKARQPSGGREGEATIAVGLEWEGGITVGRPDALHTIMQALSQGFSSAHPLPPPSHKAHRAPSFFTPPPLSFSI